MSLASSTPHAVPKPNATIPIVWLVPSIVCGIIGGIIWKLSGKESLTDEIDLIIAQEEAAANH